MERQGKDIKSRQSSWLTCHRKWRRSHIYSGLWDLEECSRLNRGERRVNLILDRLPGGSRSPDLWEGTKALLAHVSQIPLPLTISVSQPKLPWIFLAAPPPPPPMIRNGARDAPPPPPPYRMHGSEPLSRGKPPPPPSRTPAGPPPPPPPPLRNGHRDSITTVRSFLGK